VIRYLARFSKRGDVIASLGVGESCHGSVGIVTVLHVDVLFDGRFSNLTKGN
jgi:hypothetical protein